MGFKLLAINGSLTPPPSRTRIALDVALDFNEQKQIQGKLLEDLVQLGQAVVILARFLKETP